MSEDRKPSGPDTGAAQIDDGDGEYSDPTYMRPEHLLPAAMVMGLRTSLSRTSEDLAALLGLSREVKRQGLALLSSVLPKCGDCGEERCEKCAGLELSRTRFIALLGCIPT